ncbi:metallophosphatase [Saccharibacillus sp. O23]|uniref:metallophosphoesterase family protein n=1 Tax=Saccharibacillus sp. O23 TaxID=2009338 RepID=UPI000B4E5F53|nr:metallophosphoesterase family protein [Saccharibacillus sp. O23]OWR29231.1 metallophosphatase [Saccharibacillus sp. O23]
MIYITGDVHGAPRIGRRLNMRNFPRQKGLTKNDYVIVVGDFGLIWNLDAEDRFWLKWLDRTKSFTTLFIDGNHENFDLLERFPEEEWNGGKARRINDSVLHLTRGQVFELEGLTLFAFGGAASHDREFRKEGVSWWAREMPSETEYAEGLRNLERHDWKVDIVLTHTCSRSALESIGQRIGTEVEPDGMHDYFQRIEDRLSFGSWWFGHYHADLELPGGRRLIYENIVEFGGKASGGAESAIST